MAAFITGIIGSLILVTGAALPDRKVRYATQSIKDWCFMLGAIVMLAFSVMNYQAGAPVFFVFLELLVSIASILMMLNVPEKTASAAVVISGLALIVVSLFLFHGISTVLFIIGLAAIAAGYVSTGGTFHREIILLIGSALIALFSYLSASWIFCWLNVFFAAFSGYNAWKIWRESNR